MDDTTKKHKQKVIFTATRPSVATLPPPSPQIHCVCASANNIVTNSVSVATQTPRGIFAFAEPGPSKEEIQAQISHLLSLLATPTSNQNIATDTTVSSSVSSEPRQKLSRNQKRKLKLIAEWKKDPDSRILTQRDRRSAGRVANDINELIQQHNKKVKQNDHPFTTTKYDQSAPKQ